VGVVWGLPRLPPASASLCFLTNDDTQIAVSTDPSGGASAWRTIKAPVPIFSISCVSPTLCVGVGLEQVVPLRVTVPAATPTAAEIRARLLVTGADDRRRQNRRTVLPSTLRWSAGPDVGR
jgi:hypothetical protein